MKSTFLSHLLLHVTSGRGQPVEAAALGYLLSEKPVRPVRPVEEPPPGILRRLSADRPREEVAVPMAALPAALPPAVTARARRTPPRPWA